MNDQHNFAEMIIPNNEIVVIDVAGDYARVMTTSAAHKHALVGIGFVEESDRLSLPLKDKNDRAEVVKYSSALGRCFLTEEIGARQNWSTTTANLALLAGRIASSPGEILTSILFQSDSDPSLSSTNSGETLPLRDDCRPGRDDATLGGLSRQDTVRNIDGIAASGFVGMRCSGST